MGIFFSQQEAEEALDKHIERTLDLQKKEPAVRQELTRLWHEAPRKAWIEAQGAWLLECDGVDCMRSSDRQDYEIREVEISKMHLSGW